MSPSGPGGLAATPMRTIAELGMNYISQRAAHQSLALASLKTVRWVVHAFCSSCPPDPRMLRPRHVTRWLGSQQVAPATLRNRLSIVRTFSHWLTLEGHTPRDITLGVVGPKEPRRLPRALPAEHVGDLLAFCPDARARLVVTLMVELGLRRAEVTSIQIGDIDRRDGLLLVRGKGDRERWLPLTKSATHALAGYLSEHPATTGPLIRSYLDPFSPISPDHVGRLVSTWMRECGVKAAALDGVSAHALRHTAASDVLDGGADIRSVQLMLGHQHISTTERYLRRPDAAALRQAMEGRRYSPSHPVFHTPPV